MSLRSSEIRSLVKSLWMRQMRKRPLSQGIMRYLWRRKRQTAFTQSLIFPRAWPTLIGLHYAVSALASFDSRILLTSSLWMHFRQFTFNPSRRWSRELGSLTASLTWTQLWWWNSTTVTPLARLCGVAIHFSTLGLLWTIPFHSQVAKLRINLSMISCHLLEAYLSPKTSICWPT